MSIPSAPPKPEVSTAAGGLPAATSMSLVAQTDRTVDADFLVDVPQLSVEELTLELEASVGLSRVKLDAKGLQEIPGVGKSIAEKVVEYFRAHPDRLDLRDEDILRAGRHGVKFAIDSDAHSLLHLAHMRYGVGTAQRGRLTEEDVINTWPYTRLRRFLDKGGRRERHTAA